LPYGKRFKAERERLKSLERNERVFKGQPDTGVSKCIMWDYKKRYQRHYKKYFFHRRRYHHESYKLFVYYGFSPRLRAIISFMISVVPASIDRARTSL